MYFVRILKTIDCIITAPHCSIISCVIVGNTSMVMIYRKLNLMATTNYTSVHLTLVPNWLQREYQEYLALNTLRPRQNGRHFTDDIFKRIFFNWNIWISIKISLNFVLKGPINKIPALVQVMAWCRAGDKPLSEPKLISLLAHICVTQPQWVITSIIISICVLYQTLLHYIIWVSLDFLFNSLFSRTTNTTHRSSTLLTICEGNPPVTFWRILLLTLQSLLSKTVDVNEDSKRTCAAQNAFI